MNPVSPLPTAAPAPAVPAPTPALPPAPPVSLSDKLSSDVLAYFAPSAPTPPPPTAPAVPTPGQEPAPAPGPAPAPAVPPLPTEPAPAGAVPEPDALPADSNQWPASAIGAITALRGKRRDEKAALEAQVRDLESKLTAATGQPSKRPEAPAPATDLVGQVPEVKAARDEQAKQARIYRTAQGLLGQLEGDFEGVASYLKGVQIDVTGQSPEQVRAYLSQAVQTSQLEYGAAAIQVKALETQAAQALGAEQAQWTATAQYLAPDLAKADSALHAEYQQALALVPGMASHPRRDYMALCFIEGHKAMQGRYKRMQGPAAPAAATPTTQPPTPAPVPGAAAVLPAAAQPQSGPARLKSGKPEDVKAWTEGLAAGLGGRVAVPG